MSDVRIANSKIDSFGLLQNNPMITENTNMKRCFPNSGRIYAHDIMGVSRKLCVDGVGLRVDEAVDDI